MNKNLPDARVLQMYPFPVTAEYGVQNWVLPVW